MLQINHTKPASCLQSICGRQVTVVQLNAFMHTWHKGLKFLPKTLKIFSLLLANHTIQHLKAHLARLVKEVMGNFGKNTETFKPHNTMVALNSVLYKLGMPLQEVLKRGSSPIRLHSLYTVLEKSRTRLRNSSIGDG